MTSNTYTVSDGSVGKLALRFTLFWGDTYLQIFLSMILVNKLTGEAKLNIPSLALRSCEKYFP
jgi:hypothetical protein